MNQTLLTFLIGQIKKQGFNVLILIGVIYWFNLKYDKLETKYDELNVYVRNEFKQVIESNTKAYNDFVNNNKITQND